MRILALDQATINTGWSIFDYKSKDLIASGVLTADKKLNVDERITIMADSIIELIDIEKIEVVCHEEIYKEGGYKTAIILAKLAGAIEYTLNKKGMLYTEINAISHKALFGIKSRTRDEQKREVIKLVKLIYKKDVTDDEADAISIGYYFVNKIKIEGANKNG